MLDIMPDAPEGATLTFAGQLREVADWFEAHPEITCRSGHLYVHATTRTHLEMLAAALGDRARETADHHEVRISGQFGGVAVNGLVSLRTLGTVEPVRPAYEPILKAAVPDDEGDDFSVKVDTGGES